MPTRRRGVPAFAVLLPRFGRSAARSCCRSRTTGRAVQAAHNDRQRLGPVVERGASRVPRPCRRPHALAGPAQRRRPVFPVTRFRWGEQVPESGEGPAGSRYQLSGDGPAQRLAQDGGIDPVHGRGSPILGNEEIAGGRGNQASRTATHSRLRELRGFAVSRTHGRRYLPRCRSGHRCPPPAGTLGGLVETQPGACSFDLVKIRLSMSTDGWPTSSGGGGHDDPAAP